MQEDHDHALKAIARPLRLTLLGMWAERLARCFWPLWSILLLLLSALAFGVQDVLPLEAAWAGLVLAILGALWTLWRGLRAFHRQALLETTRKFSAALILLLSKLEFVQRMIHARLKLGPIQAISTTKEGKVFGDREIAV